MAEPAYEFEMYDRANGSIGVFEGSYGAFGAVGSYRLNQPTRWVTRHAASQFTGNGADGYPLFEKLRRCMKVRRTRTDGATTDLIFNGLLWSVSIAADENDDYMIECTWVDPMVWWAYRYVRSTTGSLVNPTWASPISGAEILLDALTNSVSNSGDPGDQEGPLGLDLTDGTFDTTSQPDLALTLSNWPATIADLASILLSTGAIDIKIDPVDDADGYDPDIMGVLSILNPRGADLSASVSFKYATSPYNARAATYVGDASIVANKLWYYLGPKKTASRWAGNFTPPADSSGAHGFAAYGLDDATLEAARLGSIDDLGTWMRIEVFDDNGNENLLRPLYAKRWQTETLLRLYGRDLLHVTPSIEPVYYPFEDYNLGDLITVQTGASFGREINGEQRVYGFDVSPDDNGVERVSEILTSADQESI